MFKFIKDEIELMTGSEPNDKSMFIKFLVLFGLTTCMIIYTHKTSLAFIYKSLNTTKSIYSFSSESYCSAPLSPEFTLLIMLASLAAIIIIMYDSHRLEK